MASRWRRPTRWRHVTDVAAKRTERVATKVIALHAATKMPQCDPGPATTVTKQEPEKTFVIFVSFVADFFVVFVAVAVVAKASA